jgi:hypothetical protein
MPRGGHFKELAKTPEGRAQLAEWRANGAKKAGKPQGATHGYTRHTRNKMIAKAEAEAKVQVDRMIEEGKLDAEDPLAREAMDAIATLMRRTDINPKDKLAAARTILEWTKAKPASDTNLNVRKAEDFLAEIAGDL